MDTQSSLRQEGLDPILPLQIDQDPPAYYYIVNCRDEIPDSLDLSLV